ncbi:hypothetical protein MRX96_052448 [Rhipicephalus microplus]
MTNVMIYMIMLLLAPALGLQNFTDGWSVNGSATEKTAGTRAPIHLGLFDSLKEIRDIVERSFTSVPPSLIRRLLNAQIDFQCRAGLLRTLSAFHNLRPWALKLFDASGKLPTGLFQGSRADLGAFDECLELVVHDDRGNIVTRGRYCNLLVYINNATAAERTIGSLSSVLHPKGVQVAGWCVSVSCLLLCVFMKLAWYRNMNPISEVETLAAAFFERILWSVFLVWITLVCSTGRGGFIGNFLAWDIFAPLSRLTFGVYLIHFPFLQLLLRASRERIHWSTFNMVTLLFGVLIWSFLLAFAAFILCEAPTNALSKLALGALMGKRRRRSEGHRQHSCENVIKAQLNGENKVLPQGKEIGNVASARGVIGAS